MDFGSFWGLTVPQLVTADINMSTFKQASLMLNNSHDVYKLHNLLSEIENLEYVLDKKITLEYKDPDMRKLARKIEMSEDYYNTGKPCKQHMLLSENEVKSFKKVIANAEKSVPSRMKVDGVVREISPASQVIINYFLDRKYILSDYRKNIKVNVSSEIVVFGRKLEDIIYGSPNLVKYNFNNRIKNAKKFKVTLENALDSIKKDIKILEPLIKKREERENTNLNISVNNGQVYDRYNVVPVQYHPLVVELDRVGVLRLLDLGNIRTLIELYKIAITMTSEFYNNEFGLNLTDTEYESVFDELDSIGLVGLNIHAVDFLFNSLGGALFARPVDFTIDENSELANNLLEIARALDGRREYGEEI